jgi:hypothetical protein
VQGAGGQQGTWKTAMVLCGLVTNDATPSEKTLSVVVGVNNIFEYTPQTHRHAPQPAHTQQYKHTHTRTHTHAHTRLNCVFFFFKTTRCS